MLLRQLMLLWEWLFVWLLKRINHLQGMAESIQMWMNNIENDLSMQKRIDFTHSDKISGKPAFGWLTILIRQNGIMFDSSPPPRSRFNTHHLDKGATLQTQLFGSNGFEIVQDFGVNHLIRIDCFQYDRFAICVTVICIWTPKNWIFCLNCFENA